MPPPVLLAILLQDAPAQPLDGLPPWALVLGPFGLTVYLLWDNWNLKKDNKELRRAAEEMAKAALAALKKVGGGEG